ncbi:MAG: CCA tRNA nucleotidyltransferase [Oligoflexia bacterium]|nr:CCA tRNA nucleotidyltransferase [Oligoflexia bacterium]
MPQPPVVRALALACRDAGGRAFVVGGSVRDGLLGLPVKDVDIEVHGIDGTTLEGLLRRLGRVNQVGRSFGVYKLTVKGQTVDVSIPRRDSKVGAGHRGIAVVGDPQMGLVAATRRRDLTINAMLLDPLTGALCDPFGGQADLAQKRLRAVDPATFLEDPLRALRVVQFAGRLAFEPDEQLVALCRAAPLKELPAERVMAEVEKLLLGARRPSLGLGVARRTGVLERILPGVAACPAETVDAAIDRAAGIRAEAGPAPRPLALMLATLLHGLDPALAELALDRLRVHSRSRYPLRVRVLGAIAGWAAIAEGPDDTCLRALAEHEDLGLLCRVAWAVSGALSSPALRRARQLGVDSAPLPILVRGRDLHQLGILPGPKMGELLANLRRAQVEGRVQDQAQALRLAAELLAGNPSLDEEPS